MRRPPFAPLGEACGVRHSVVKVWLNVLCTGTAPSTSLRVRARRHLPRGRWEEPLRGGGGAATPIAPPPPTVGCSAAWTRPGLRLPADLPLLRFPPPLGASVSGPSPEARTSAKAAASPARKQQRPGPERRGAEAPARARASAAPSLPRGRAEGGERLPRRRHRTQRPGSLRHPSESRDACRGFRAKPCSCHRARGTAGVTAPAPLAV